MGKESVKIDDVYVAAIDGKLTFSLPHAWDGCAFDNWKSKHARQLMEMKLRSKGLQTEVHKPKELVDECK